MCYHAMHISLIWSIMLNTILMMYQVVIIAMSQSDSFISSDDQHVNKWTDNDHFVVTFFHSYISSTVNDKSYAGKIFEDFLQTMKIFPTNFVIAILSVNIYIKYLYICMQKVAFVLVKSKTMKVFRILW